MTVPRSLSVRRIGGLLMLGAGLGLTGQPAHALTELRGIEKIEVGGAHSCALTTGGGVKCWGNNDAGQLGDNSTTSRPTPIGVTGLASGVVAISAGGDHSCAITTVGAMKCWGRNVDGELGDNSTTNRPVPVEVTGLTSGVAAISAGNTHTCALMANGAVKCWGKNASGQLGDSSITNRPTPIEVAGLASGVVAIAAGGNHSCALMTTGAMKCWGGNDFGQLGDNSTSGRLTPVEVAGLARGIAAISAGFLHTCALSAGGDVKCWGRNAEGQLGDNSTSARLTPADVTGLTSRVEAISAGGSRTCALATGGGVKCWGLAPGDSSTTSRLTPVDVTGLASGVAAISLGDAHACALTTDGRMRCWGDGRNGQLGDYSSQVHWVPTDVTGLRSGIAAISAGEFHTCALTSGGGVKCWGKNDYGQSGDGSGVTRLTPVDVKGLTTGVAAISASGDHTCALTTGGGVKCWGSTSCDRCNPAAADIFLEPVDVAGLASGVTAIAAGEGHACALTTGGGVKCWGRNEYGALGDNSTVDRVAPVDVVGLGSGVSAIAAGGRTTCALAAGGVLKCWGRATLDPEAGSIFLRNSLTPVDTHLFGPVVAAVSVGGGHTCALFPRGAVACWGGAFSGQTGRGVSTVPTTLQTNFVGLSEPAGAISLGGVHSCALSTSGAMTCWGGNNDGQLGSSTGFGTIVAVRGLASRVAAISAGGANTCALTTFGAVKCWGSDRFGQLGDGTAWNRPSPVTVLTGVAAPAFFDFGGQEMRFSAPVGVVTLINAGAEPLVFSGISLSGGHFTQANDCTALAVGDYCTVTVTFTPTAEGALGGSLTVTSNMDTQTIALAGTGERSLVTHYYRSILRRAPDAAGKAFWNAEALRVQGLGVSVNEVWYSMAGSFYASAEYRALNRDDAGYVTDLYNTFFNRSPDAAGLADWTALLAAGMPREVVLASFMFSPEFGTFTQAIFGTIYTRKEVDTVVDFYRGLLGRLPDSAGFAYWLQPFRTAQCQGAAGVLQVVESISREFTQSAEQMERNRTSSQYVGDLYNAFLRRGGDLAGVRYWIGQLDSGARTRDNVRREFMASPEFSARVASVIAQGCLQ